VRDIYSVEEELNALERAKRSISAADLVATNALAENLRTAHSVVADAAREIELQR
jgi:hypothetical protein